MTLERAVLFEHLRRILVPLHENAHQNNNNIGDDKGKELKLIKELLGVTSPFVLLIKPGSSHDKEHAVGFRDKAAENAKNSFFRF